MAKNTHSKHDIGQSMPFIIVFCDKNSFHMHCEIQDSYFSRVQTSQHIFVYNFNYFEPKHFIWDRIRPYRTSSSVSHSFKIYYVLYSVFIEYIVRSFHVHICWCCRFLSFLFYEFFPPFLSVYCLFTLRNWWFLTITCSPVQVHKVHTLRGFVMSLDNNLFLFFLFFSFLCILHKHVVLH